MAPKTPQYRELRSLEAESIRSLAPLREVGLARRGAARRSAADLLATPLPPTPDLRAVAGRIGDQ